MNWSRIAIRKASSASRCSPCSQLAPDGSDRACRAVSYRKKTRATFTWRYNCPMPLRSNALMRPVAKSKKLLSQTPGVQHTTSIIGFNLVTFVQNSYSAFFFVTLKPWSERTKPEEQYDAIKMRLTKELAGVDRRRCICISTAGHSRRWHVRRIYFCAGRSLRERHRLPGAEPRQVYRSRAQTAGDRRHCSRVFTRRPASLRQRRSRQGSEAGNRHRTRFTQRCKHSWAATSSITSTASDEPGRST